MGIVYIATNRENGKYYIGKSENDLSIRRAQHYDAALYGNSETHFHNALRKYPKESFTWRILDRADSPEELNNLEMEYIELFMSAVPEIGYNGTHGGEGARLTEEGRRKISQSNKGKIRSPEFCENQSKRMLANHHRYWLGKKRPPEQIENIRKGHLGKPSPLKGRPLSEEHKAKLRGKPEPQLGKPHTEETKRKISEAKKGCPASFKGRNHTEEAKAKMSAAKKGRPWKRKEEGYPRNCALCNTPMVGYFPGDKFCEKCRVYFTKEQRTKLCKKLKTGESIERELAGRDSPRALAGQGHCIVCCKQCGVNFRAEKVSYRFCPTCKEARNGDQVQ